MEKEKIIKFISKYNLNGNIESVIWKSENDELKTKFISDNKKLLGELHMKNIAFPECNIGINTTSQLKSFLSILDNFVNIEITDTSLGINDDNTTVNYMLADTSIIPSTPNLKYLPEMDILINLDKKFIETFIKSKNALSNINNFTVISSEGKAKIVIGHSNNNSNKISFEACTLKGSKGIKNMSFLSDLFKEILVANKDFQYGTFEISDKGISKIEFSGQDYVSTYFLEAIQEEE